VVVVAGEVGGEGAVDTGVALLVWEKRMIYNMAWCCRMHIVYKGGYTYVYTCVHASNTEKCVQEGEGGEAAGRQ